MLEHGLSFILDTPSEDTSLVQIAKTGKFKDPRYGVFTITQQHFQKWIDNFNALSSPAAGRMGLPVDVDHGPEKRGDTEAVGWIKSLAAKGNELWAKVEWNELGQELIREKRYAYLSPSYQFDHQDETGKQHGTALVGVGMTNRPFLSMATVSLCAAGFALEEEPGPGEPEDPDQSGSATRPRQTPESPRLMTDFTKNTAKALGLAEDADEATILAAVESAVAKPASEDKSLDDLAKENGKVLLDAGQVNALAADARAGREAQEELHLAKFSAAFDSALDQGRAVPAQKDTLLELYGSAPEQTLKLLSESPQSVPVTPKGSTGSALGGDIDLFEGQKVDEDSMELHRQTEAISLARSIPYEEALDLASRGVTA